MITLLKTSSLYQGAGRFALGHDHNKWHRTEEVLPILSREDLEDELHRQVAGASFFQRENPFVRHIFFKVLTFTL